MTLTRTQAKDLLQKYDISPRKSLGQNFVVEPNTIRQVIELASIKSDDFVIEVGPGIGSLTSSLLEVAGHVTAVEVDRALVEVLKDLLQPEDKKFRLINADVMNLDVNELLVARNQSWNLVANLPYNISVPLICDFLERVPVITKMTVMVQREVAERLVAKAGEKAFGLPSLKVQYFAEVKKIEFFFAKIVQKSTYLPLFVALLSLFVGLLWTCLGISTRVSGVPSCPLGFSFPLLQPCVFSYRIYPLYTLKVACYCLYPFDLFIDDYIPVWPVDIIFLWIPF